MRAISLPLSARVARQYVPAFVLREPWILGAWAIQRPLFLFLTWLVHSLGVATYMNGRVTLETLIVPWINWDGGGYRFISQHGYFRLQEAAFSPLYPALIRLFSFLPLSELWVSSLAELAALYLLFDLLKRRYSVKVARRAVLFLAWTPFAVIFTAAYTESLFLLLSVGVFWALQRERLLLAGVCAALAALTRQYGILLCLPLLGTWSWRRLAALVMPVVSVAIYWVALSLKLHTPFAPISSVQGQYARHLTWPWTGIINTLLMQDGPHSFFLIQHTVVDLVLVVVALALSVRLYRQGWREAVYVWASMLVILCMPIATSTHSNIDALASAPRYLMVLFPLYIPLAQWAKTPMRTRLVMWSSLLGVMYLAIFFAAGIWIG